jgi:hypothetical protein
MVSPLEVADVVELWVWGSGQSMTVSQLEGHLETAIPEESIETNEEGAFEPFELLAQQVFDEFVQRQDRLGVVYPFACDGYQVGYPNGGGTPYIFCLLLSYLPANQIHQAQRAPQFELLAMDAARGFFGGTALRIGWPWDRSTYAELLEDVVALLPDLGQINLPEPVVAGDRGWDIIIVKGFGDNLYPRFVALGNCATGRNDWKMKGLETQPDFFWRCFQHQLPGAWVTFSAVPFPMDEDIRQRKASQSNLTFDRYRICEFAGALCDDAELWLAQQYQNATNVPLDASI